MLDILKFQKILNEFGQVKRTILVNGENRMENDIEHSYQLAMLAWYIVSLKDLDLDIDLVIKYALIHDFVEVYAGDTYVYSEDEELKASKEQREKDAAERLKKEFSEFSELHDLIDEYENKKDKESKFIYALDKIQPVLNIYMDGGRTWKEKDITLSMLIESKKDKVSISKDAQEYFNKIIEILKENEKELFNKISYGK